MDAARFKSISVSRDPLSVCSKLSNFALNTLFVIPSVSFLIYAWSVDHNNGTRIDVFPVPELRTAAKYGPTVFPVAFAGVMGAFLTSTASWRLEHGISKLSLEYLVSSRTVFSAVTTPFSLRSVNLLAPLLLVLWMLSPMGGQAALRVIEIIPGTHSEPWEYIYLDVMSPALLCSLLIPSLTPSIVGTFNAGLAAPGYIKNSSMDAFGNLKIPMLESCLNSGVQPDEDGWVDTTSAGNCNSASIVGLPFRGNTKANHSFSLETSYTYSDCSVNHTLADPSEGTLKWIQDHHNSDVTNLATLGMSLLNRDSRVRKEPQRLLFDSYLANAKTSATCSLSQTYVEAEVFCQWTNCKVERIRNSTLPHSATYLLPLHLLPLQGQWEAATCSDPTRRFLQALVNSSMTYSSQDVFSSPLEYYIVNPDSPYSVNVDPKTGWRGADIYPVGDQLFSERFSQLWNTWWLSNIAPDAVMGIFGPGLPGTVWAYNISNSTGTMTPDIMQLHSNRVWLIVLGVASLVMLAASVANVVLGLMQTRPDILERISILAKDSPNTFAAYQDGARRHDAKVRLRDVRLSLRDSGTQGSNYSVVKTVDDDTTTQ